MEMICLFVILGIVIVIVSASLQEQLEKGLQDRLTDWDSIKSKLRSGQTKGVDLEKWIKEGEQLSDDCESHANLHSKERHTYNKFSRISNSILEDIRAYGSALAGAATSSSPSVLELARLRSAGMISNDEFTAFSERFEMSTGEKAQDIIKAIEDLNVQRKAGAMSEGNYRASLWTLMDRLDQSK